MVDEMFDLKFKIITAVVLASLASAGWFYVKKLQSDIKAAEVREQQYKDVIEAKSAETNAIKQDLAAMAEGQKKLAEQIKVANTNVDSLEKRFTETKSGKERDIRTSAIAKPELIEKAINNGTKEALRCGEVLTGAPLTENEKAGKVTNSICPDIIKAKKK